MTVANAERCIANTLVYEGGFTIIRSDPGNWTGGKVGVGQLKGTNFGIAANTYPNLDIRALTRDQAIAIYKRDYWPKAGGDLLPKGIDQISYDGTVNSGPGRGPKWVGQALGLPASAKLAEIAAAAHVAKDKTVVIKKAVAIRMSFLRSLGIFGTFGGGWTKRCAAMEALGVKMALEERGLSSADVGKSLKKESAAANTRSAGSMAGATASAAPVTQAPKIDPSTFDWTAWLFAGALTLALVAGVALFGWLAWKHRLRARAYLDVITGKIGG